MSITSLLAALAITAVQPTPWACDLASGIGQGSSDQGRIDSISTLNLGCRYQLFNVMGVGISPQLGVDKQLWTVYQKDSFKKDIHTYETNGMNLGFRLEAATSSRTRVVYGFAAGQGKGNLNLTQSTSQSSLSGSFSNVKNNYMQHTVSGNYAVTDNLSLTLGFQRQFANQSWSADRSSILLQNVDENNSLTLTGGTLALVDSRTAPRTSSHASMSLIQLGLSFQFGK